MEGSLEIVDYNMGSEKSSQHPRWADVMSSSSRMPREEVLYRDENISRAEKRAM